MLVTLGRFFLSIIVQLNYTEVEVSIILLLHIFYLCFSLLHFMATIICVSVLIYVINDFADKRLKKRLQLRQML